MNKFIPVSEPFICGNEKKYLNECVESKWISSGKFVDRFEEELTKYLSSEPLDEVRVASCSSGTAALHLALVALDVGPGDEVIIPASTFVATLNTVFYTGATPIIVDVEMERWGVDPAAVEKAITPNTKAVIGVHLYGYPFDIEKVSEICKKQGVFLVEDSAEAFGAELNGRKLGTIGDLGTFSFYGNKVITTGEGGGIYAKNPDHLEKIKKARNHSMDEEIRYFHKSIGYNYRMTNLQAAFGVAQLECISSILDRREEIEEYYISELSNLPIEIRRKPENAKPVNWLFTFLCDGAGKLRQFLKKNNIDTRGVFYPMSELPYVNDKSIWRSTPHARQLYERGVSLPTYPDLKEENLEKIVSTVRAFYEK